MLKKLQGFFRDLLTLSELKTISNRWMAARYLSKGNSYMKIANKLKVSTTTVASVAKRLNSSSGGLKRALKGRFKKLQ